MTKRKSRQEKALPLVRHFFSGAWAVWNDCEGVVEVFTQRRDAVKTLHGKRYWGGVDEERWCYVVPVHIVPELRDDYWDWHAHQHENETADERVDMSDDEFRPQAERRFRAA